MHLTKLGLFLLIILFLLLLLLLFLLHLARAPTPYFSDCPIPLHLLLLSPSLSRPALAGCDFISV